MWSVVSCGVLLGFLFLVSLVDAAEPEGSLAERTLQRRATEAVIWGMPAVNYDLMRQEMLTKTAGKVNQVIYWGRPLDWHNQTLTPNPDAHLLHGVLQHEGRRAGRARHSAGGADGSLNGNIVNVWQMPLEDAGPARRRQGRGRQVPDPAAGLRRRECPTATSRCSPDTFGGYALIRSNLESHSDADVAKSVAYGKRMKVYPLSQAANPPPTVFTDAKDVVFDSTIRYDASFFDNLDRIVQSEPWLAARPRDDRPAEVARHREGQAVHAGRGDTQALLDAASREAQAWLEARYDAGFPPFFRRQALDVPGAARADQGGAGRLMPIPTPIRSTRAASPTATRYIGIKRLGAGQFYLISIKDKDGEAFDGGKTYRLTVPPNAPVEQYWSVTAYDRQTHALIRNMAARQPLVADPRDAEERRRLGRPLLRPEGAGGQGSELGADRPGAQVRADVPRSTRRPRRCSTRPGCCRTSRSRGTVKREVRHAKP